MWLNGGAGSSAANIFPFDVELGRLVVGWGADPAGRIGLYDGGWRYFGNTPSLNTWHHIAFVCGASTVSLYVDGAPYGSAQSYTSRAIGGKVTLGSRFSYANNFRGESTRRGSPPSHVRRLGVGVVDDQGSNGRVQRQGA